MDIDFDFFYKVKVFLLKIKKISKKVVILQSQKKVNFEQKNKKYS